MLVCLLGLSCSWIIGCSSDQSADAIVSTAGGTSDNPLADVTSGNTVGSTSDNTAGDMPDNTVGSTSGNTAGDTLGNTVGSTSDNTAGDTPDNTVGSSSEITPGNTPGASVADTPENSSDPGNQQSDENQQSDGSDGSTVAIGEASGATGVSGITDLIVVTGQSNALGGDTTFDAARDTPNSRVYAFTSEGWQVADLRQIWDLNWHPRNDPATDPSNNFGFHFAKKVAERRPQKKVGFILVTAPGQGISHWDYESEFYLQIRNKVISAINELPDKATVDGILWHQGETDWHANDYYRDKLRDLIANFRTESWLAGGAPFICGETVEAPLNQLLSALNTDGDPTTGCVSSEDLSVILDNLHFSAEGLRILGTRYATKYIQMTEQ